MSYEIIEVLKETEKSKIFLCYDSEKRKMAVRKCLRGELEIYQRLKGLSHPYLPEIYSVEFNKGETVVVEEYVSNRSIAQIKADEKQIAKWFFELCDVLSFLHKHGILHRDIKPSNLMLGDDGHIRLIDFDAAREEKADKDCDTYLLGTRGYAPPEQYGFAQTDERADIYAMGITFKELLGPAAKKRKWKRVLAGCTTLEPGRRYRSVSRVRLAIMAGRLRIMTFAVLLFVIAIVCAIAILIFLDEDASSAMKVVMRTRREQVFECVNIDEIKESDAILEEYAKDEMNVYEYISEIRPDITFISTGYCNKAGYLLFGGFNSTFYIKSGKSYYTDFMGLYYIDGDMKLYHIKPDECVDYAPAVLALYELDVFDSFRIE